MAFNFTDDNFKQKVAESMPIVIDFWAEWCGPCRMVTPIIEELAAEYEGKVLIGKMNVDENSSTPAEFSVRNIPTILFIKNGEVVERHVGAASKAVLQQKVEALL
ncbi:MULTISPECIES: thioredoxin [Porphyromonas]|uniref:Thioredoxin n=1 Tax=Porphyromonas canoris TaxID=36875 RepID=A0ABR4XL94_9PORP|nr:MULTISPECIES: thioredoxin [Porphyromonas]KGL53949.1 thioredoxin [Porphyromonas canoris]KGN67470.1 thioredoxin [Porphyromonas sp. COT-108 OH1349]KGN92205.1 thioredoxin [Porphyromonas canoris]KGN96690.1 thioredoxin [Porphyromonas sp. COT-108 OH2963]